MSDVLMPRLSDSMEEGTVVRWLKADGDEVKRGEELVEIETDKAIMAYESDFSGRLSVVVPEGSTVPVGGLIGHVGDAVPAADEPNAATQARPSAPAGGRTESASAATADVAVAVHSNSDGRGPRKASPLARRTAARLGVDITAVNGSGPYGRVLKQDVLEAARGADATQPQTAAGQPVPPPAALGAPTLQAMGSTQKLIARRMTESRRTIPEFTLEVDVDMGAALSLREQLRQLADPPPSINDIILKACAVALRRHPRANGSFADDHFVLHDEVNVAFAVAAADSLVVPVISHADRKGIAEIARESRALAERVRSRTIAPSELEGGTFTVSNLGMFGIDRFQGIINAPQACILCVGAVRDRPIARDGAVQIAPMLSLTLASDHRILYGADAALFLSEIRQLLEAPLRMLA
jgi:pyruvate dehydrogenase E2 component (dihydrolipoamide acetyltransferase)